MFCSLFISNKTFESCSMGFHPGNQKCGFSKLLHGSTVSFTQRVKYLIVPSIRNLTEEQVSRAFFTLFSFFP